MTTITASFNNPQQQALTQLTELLLLCDVVVAKCPKCKKTKEYKMPVNFTPFCQYCLFIPMIIKKVKVTT